MDRELRDDEAAVSAMLAHRLLGCVCEYVNRRVGTV